MNKILLSLSAAAAVACTGAASAADLPVKAPVIPYTVSNWTGFYIGGHVGSAWSTVESNLPILGVTLPVSSASTNGMLGGFQGGFNYQVGWAVFGVEGDWSWAGIKGTAPCIAILTCTAETKSISSVSGRFGGVVGNNTLVYGKGGAVWARDTYGVSVLGLINASTSVTRNGWLFGTGVEYKFNDKWSGFVEYNYMDFRSSTVPFTFTVGAASATVNSNITERMHAIKLGVNYKIY